MIETSTNEGLICIKKLFKFGNRKKVNFDAGELTEMI